MKSKKMVVKKEPKLIIKEEIRLGFFKRKLRKEYIKLITDFNEATNKRIKIDDLITHLQAIKSFIESKLKGKYTDIFIEVEHNHSWEDSVVTYFDVVLGRLESDEEYNTRIKERKESSNRWAAQVLKSDAKRYLELKNKFEPKK